MKAIKFLALVSALLSVTDSYAQFTSGEDVVISNKVTHDLYTAGGTVSVNSPVAGDLVFAGGTITISDTVQQDILGAGSNVILSGYVGDDVRCAGGTIKVSNDVAGDLIVTGGTVEIDDDVSIAGNVMVSGGKVVVDGQVKGNLVGACGEIALNGKVEGDVECRGGKISINGTVDGNSILAANTIELGSGASFNRDVRYWNSEGELDFGNAVHGGEARFDSSLEPESGKLHYLGFASALLLLWYLGTALVMIGLIQYLFGGTFKKAADTVKNASAKSLGVGVLFLIGVPAAILVTFITIVGIPVGVLALIAYVTAVLLGTVIVSLLATHWINKTYYNSAWSMARIVFIALAIFILLKLASLTPFVGPLVMLLLACMAFGAILLTIKWRKRTAVSVS
jgi:cytoskeletal protein CcmA (bactofilin family)